MLVACRGERRRFQLTSHLLVLVLVVLLLCLCVSTPPSRHLRDFDEKLGIAQLRAAHAACTLSAGKGVGAYVFGCMAEEEKKRSALAMDNTTLPPPRCPSAAAVATISKSGAFAVEMVMLREGGKA